MKSRSNIRAHSGGFASFMVPEEDVTSFKASVSIVGSRLVLLSVDDVPASTLKRISVSYVDAVDLFDLGRTFENFVYSAFQAANTADTTGPDQSHQDQSDLVLHVERLVSNEQFIQ